MNKQQGKQKKNPQNTTKTGKAALPQEVQLAEAKSELEQVPIQEALHSASTPHANSAIPKESSIEESNTHSSEPYDESISLQSANEESIFRITSLEAEKSELKEALLRKQADFENYRRRMQKEKEESIQFANRGLITELLEVLDNFDRALSIHRSEETADSTMKEILDGMGLVEQQLFTTLSEKWGLKLIESIGEEFDPNFHEALMMEESSDVTVTTVVETFQSGYTLNGRVIRPARVKVVKASN